MSILEEDFELELAALLTAQDAADPQEHDLRHEEPCNTAGVQPRKPKRQRRSPSDLAASPAPAAGLPGPLAQLSEALLLRVLCFLAPEDLMTLGRTSRLFHEAASDTGLWRRLYLHRWPQGPKNGEAEGEEEGRGPAAGVNWKVLYQERDHQELSEFLQAAPALLKPLYAQMATAKRSEAPLRAEEHLFRPPKPATPARRSAPRGAGGAAGGAGGGAGGPGGGRMSHQELMQQVAAEIDAFRRQRGLTDPALHAAHCCGGGECRGFVHLRADVWICASTGFVHRCGEACGEREVDPASNNMVCQISGRCFERMMSEDEEEQAQRGGDEEWQAEEGISGRLGRAFYAGYNATDESDLLRQFGGGSGRTYIWRE